MENFKLNEQIAFLRKQKGITQEELALALGVTNQAVSKWESSQCCPDIQLLPDIARYFGVSTDELLGYKTPDSFEDIFLKIKAMFKNTPAESAFRDAYRLSVLLHEAAVTRGYKEYCPWDAAANHGLEEKPYKWGFSACSEPEGNTVHVGNAVFIADGTLYQPPVLSQIRDLMITLKNLANSKVLAVLFALYELTSRDFDLYVTLDRIAEKAALDTDETENALSFLPVTVADAGGEKFSYRLEGSYMHVPPLLLMLRTR